jgi:hypothetical protein
MAYLGSWKIDDNLTFCGNTHDPDTGVATDADSVPTYRVYEDETGTAILNGSMAKLDDANTVGFYSEQIALSAANGFEKGKCYTIYISATVDSDTGTMHHTLQIEAEVDCNTASDLHADLDDGGRLDLLIDAIKAVTDNLPDSGALNDLAAILADTGTDGVVLADNAITAAKIDTNAIDAGAIAANAIGASEIADNAIDAGAIAANAITAAKIATDAFTSDEFAASALQEIADQVLKRGVANVEASADVDSLAAIILAIFHSAISGSTWTIKRTDDSTSFDTYTITTDSGADPVTGVADPT